MYKYSLFSPTLSDEQKKEIFNVENLKEMLRKLNEKRENAEMTETDILIDTLIQQQNNILNKAQIVDGKGEAYKLSKKNEVLENLIAAYEVVEKDFDSSIESFEKTEEAIDKAWESISQLELNEDEFNSELSFVNLEIGIHEPEISRFYSKDYLVEYSIEESNRVTRGGRMIFNLDDYDEGALANKVSELIKQYQEELHGEEIIKYKGFI